MRTRQTIQTVTGGRRSRDAAFLLHAGDSQSDWSGPIDAPRLIPAGSTTWHGLELGPVQRIALRD